MKKEYQLFKNKKEFQDAVDKINQLVQESKNPALAKRLFDMAMDIGYEQGYDQGYDEGYDDGYIVGENDGYEDALTPDEY